MLRITKQPEGMEIDGVAILERVVREGFSDERPDHFQE